MGGSHGLAVMGGDFGYDIQDQNLYGHFQHISCCKLTQVYLKRSHQD